MLATTRSSSGGPGAFRRSSARSTSSGRCVRSSTTMSTHSLSSWVTARITPRWRRSHAGSESPTAAGYVGFRRHPPLVRGVRRAHPDLGERGHASGRDRGARSCSACGRDPGWRHGAPSSRHGETDSSRRSVIRGRWPSRLRMLERDPGAPVSAWVRSGAGGRARPLRNRAHGRRDRDRLSPPARDEGPAPPQADRRERVRGAPAGLASRPFAKRGVDARFLGLDVPGSDAPRFYESP